MSSADYHFNETVTVSMERVMKCQEALYQAAGMSAKDAHTVAEHLVTADARGVYSHGIQRSSLYFKRFEVGGTSVTAQPEVVRNFGATALVDGKNSMGMVAATFGMQKAIELAKKYGTSAVSITGSNHFGTCARYAEMAADAGMIGYCWTINAVNIMAPTGGTERMLGNNPYAIAVPCATRPNVVMDMATSVVARGKIVMAKKTHAPIPDTWALDVNGNKTTDPVAAYEGTVQPFAGYKGYCQTFMNAVMSAVLNNSSFGPDIIDLYEEPEKVQNSGHLMQCINIDAIDDVAAFKKRMDEAVAYIKNGAKAEGVKEIFVPGEIEANNLKRARVEGIVYPMEVILENRALAEKYNVPEDLRL